MRAREAAAVTIAYQAALTQLGVRVSAAALALWARSSDPSRATWLDEAVDLVMDARVAAFELGVAYIRLYRALMTGATVRSPYAEAVPNTTLGRLRAEFLELLPADLPDDVQYRPPGGGEDDSIAVEGEIFDRAETATRERAAREELREQLVDKGPDALRRRQDKIDELVERRSRQGKSLTAEELRELQRDADAKSARGQASAAERIAKNGARGAVHAATTRDPRALGWVRISRTGTPCGWCAMLMSRGPVYKSESSASRRYSDGDLYHDNCKCVTIPVYMIGVYEHDELFELNRQYAVEWPRVTAGLSGKAAVAAWRRHVRQQQA